MWCVCECLCVVFVGGVWFLVRGVFIWCVFVLYFLCDFMRDGLVCVFLVVCVLSVFLCLECV